MHRSPVALLAFALGTLLFLTACRPREPEGTQAAATPSPTPSPASTPQPPAAATATGDLTSDLAPPTGPAADLPQDRPLRAGFLVVDGVYNSELVAPYDVFHHTVFHVKPGIEVFTVSPDGKPITTFEGIRITPTYGFQNAPAIDLLVVPSARGSMDADLQNRTLVDWVRQTGGSARHVLSLCDGAFVLAQAGLLDGVPATTFPDDYERLAKTFPNVDLRINVSFVDAGKILTSEGGARSYEVAMYLVDRLYGPQVATEIGKGLLIPWPAPPGKLKYVTAPPAVAGKGGSPPADSDAVVP
ncbi:MAG TPA: DJ-1/PfpI family protein [Thermoanaerobaculia bacterium]|jgi:transcriptional regulator GlxA family with amidase domain|nr:DJ-1/PfpI family protein [Thermoanaerobaculia bacterium]